MCTDVFERWTCGDVGDKIETYSCKHYRDAQNYMNDKGVSSQHTTVRNYLYRCKNAKKIAYKDLSADCRRCLADAARRG